MRGKGDNISDHKPLKVSLPSDFSHKHNLLGNAFAFQSLPQRSLLSLACTCNDPHDSYDPVPLYLKRLRHLCGRTDPIFLRFSFVLT